MALLPDVEKTQKELESCWIQKMADFESRLNAATSPSNPTLLQLKEEFRAFKDLVTKMLHLLGQQVRENAKAIDIMDMRNRQKVLLLNGIPEDPDTDVEQKVLGLFHNTLGLTHITSSSLKRCHRLGIKNKDNVRAVLVHFCDHRSKAEVWSLKAKFKATPVSMAEFLTRSRQLVHKRARKHFGMRNVWTLDGTIYIKLPGGGRAKIFTEEDLNALVAKYPEQLMESAGPRGNCGECDGIGAGHAGQHSVPNANRQMEVRRKQFPVGTLAEDNKRVRRAAPKK